MSSEGESCLRLGGEGGLGVGGGNSATTTLTSTMIHRGPDDTYPV